MNNLIPRLKFTVKSMHFLKVILLAFIISLNVSQVLASDLVINSGNSGTQSNPTVYDGGIYDRLLITTASNIIVRNATFISNNSDGSGDFGVVEISSGNNITIENCTIDGLVSGGASAAACHGVDITGGSKITIRNCTITQYADDAIEVSGGTNGLTVKGCTIKEGYSCGTDGGCGPCSNGHGDAIEIWDLTDGIFDGNLIHIEDATSGFITGGTNTNLILTNNIFYTPGSGFSVYLYNTIRGCKVYNNTIWQATYGGIALGGSSVDDLYIYNNIVQSINYKHFNTSQQSDHYIDYNVLGESNQGYTPNTNDTINNNPNFVNCPQLDGAELSNPTSSDFQLQSTSVAINRGLNNQDSPDYDISNSMRDANPDIGAWEYGASTSYSGALADPTGLQVVASSNTDNTTDDPPSSDPPTNTDPPTDSTVPKDTTPTNYTNLGKPIRYVRSGANGTGTGLNWTDAYRSLPSTLTRDYIYFIADGNYGRYTFNDATSGDSYIYIVKATSDDHGTDTGWQPQYGDGQALFTSSAGDTIVITTNNWIIDGKTRDSWDSGYGFRFSNTTPLSTQIVKVVRLSSGVSNVTTRYSDMQHRGDGYPDVGDDVFYAPGSRSSIRISYCYLHDASKNGIVMIGSDHVMEYSLMARVKGTGGTHSQGLQIFGRTNNFTIRNNIFENIFGTAVIACAWGTDGLYVYGNVFYQPDSSYVTSPATIVDISDANETGITNALIYNNTFYSYHASSGHPGVQLYYSTNSSTNRIYNNLFVDTDEIVLDAREATHAYNHFINSSLAYGTSQNSSERSYSEINTLVNPSAYDFTLVDGKGPKDSGSDLGASYNTDPLGNQRGADGAWDVGAYEL